VLKYVMRRLVMLIGIVFVISIGSFYLIHLLPGDPAVVILGTGASPAAKAILFHQLGLDKPVYLQYFTWISNVARGNMGTSFISQSSVAATIRAALPIDLEIIVLSQVLAFAAAIPAAMRSARKPDGAIDRLLGASSFTLLSVPPFIIIVLLVLLISIKLGIPHTGPSSYVTLTSDPIGNLESLSLPAFTLAIGSFVVYYRVLRSDLIATLQTVVGRAARHGQRQHRRTARERLRRPVSPRHPGPRLHPHFGNQHERLPAGPGHRADRVGRRRRN
jgi:peptide/nickel transport system permease protein